MSDILVIDDNKAICAILKKHLSKAHVVETANSLHESLEKCKNFIPQVVILDLNLGDGHGEDFVNAGCVPDDATVIVVSAANNPEKRAETMFPDREYYVLRKPFQISEVSDIVNKANVHHAIKKVVDRKRLGTKMINTLKELNKKLDHVNGGVDYE